MNIMTSNPTVAQQFARQVIDDRVRDAEQRRLARASRTRHHDERTPQPPSTTGPVPWWTFRFLRPAH
jgi:hypothetical protein